MCGAASASRKRSRFDGRDVATAAHAKTPLLPKDRQPPVKQTKVSHAGPDTGHMLRHGKPNGFSDLDHRTVNGGVGTITDTDVTRAGKHDRPQYRAQLNRRRKRFDLDVKAVGLPPLTSEAEAETHKSKTQTK